MPPELKEMVNSLLLTNEPIWDIALYWIFFLNIILLFIQPEGSAMGTMLAIAAIVSAVIDKTRAFGYMMDPGYYDPIRYHEQIFIGTYLIRVIMFAAPLSIAGMTKSPKTRFVAVIAGVSGGVYMFARWFFQQRNVTSTDIGIGFLAPEIALQTAGMTLIVARIALGKRLRAFAVDRNIPVTIARDLAPDDVEIELA